MRVIPYRQIKALAKKGHVITLRPLTNHKIVLLYKAKAISMAIMKKSIKSSTNLPRLGIMDNSKNGKNQSSGKKKNPFDNFDYGLKLYKILCNHKHKNAHATNFDNVCGLHAWPSLPGFCCSQDANLTKMFSKKPNSADFQLCKEHIWKLSESISCGTCFIKVFDFSDIQTKFLKMLSKFKGVKYQTLL